MTTNHFKNLFTCIHAAVLYMLSGIMVVLAVATLVLPFHYNHWVGGLSRMLFVVIYVFVAGPIIACFANTYDNYAKPGTFVNYWVNSIVVSALIAILVFVAGFTVHNNTQCWDEKSGRLETYHGIRWDNPFKRSIVLVKDVKDDFKLTVSLFPDREIKINPHARVRLGTSADKLAELEYTTATGNPPKDSELEQVINTARDGALLNCGATLNDLAGQFDGNPTKQQKFVEIIKAEVQKNLPPHLESTGVEVTVEPMTVEPKGE